MTKYKVQISIDGENFFYVIIENGKVINRDTTREELVNITTREYCYNKTNICPRCREENNITDKGILYPGNAVKGYKKGSWKGKWLCTKCYMRDYNKEYRGYENILKPLANRRTGNLRDLNNILGDDCEKLTDIVFGTKRLSVLYDNYELPLDHTPIPEGVSLVIGGELVDLSGKILQTKGGLLTNLSSYKNIEGEIKYYKGWSFDVHRERYKEFDYEICYCTNKDGMLIEMIYIFIKEEIIKHPTIRITKIPTNRQWSISPWYEKCRVEEILGQVNKTWKQIRGIRGANGQYQEKRFF